MISEAIQSLVSMMHRLIAFEIVTFMREMAGTHPQGMDHRNFDGKTGGESTMFSKACFAIILVLILIMIVIFLPR